MSDLVNRWMGCTSPVSYVYSWTKCVIEVCVNGKFAFFVYSFGMDMLTVVLLDERIDFRLLRWPYLFSHIQIQMQREKT